jgi:hypothetical protein
MKGPLWIGHTTGLPSGSTAICPMGRPSRAEHDAILFRHHSAGMQVHQTWETLMPKRSFGVRCPMWLRLMGCTIAIMGALPPRANATPTEADVDVAIKACTVMTRTDANIEGGLLTLKRRILSGEGKIGYSEIPSVIGAPVTTEESKIRLFERIQDCVIKNTYGSVTPFGMKQGALGPGSPTAAYLRNPPLAPMQATTKSGDGSIIGGHEIGLYGCSINGNTIDCYLTETPLSYSRSYNINSLFGQETRLTDDLHITHGIIRSAWIDGIGNQHRDMDIGKNEPAWFVLEFNNANPDANDVRITFRAFTGGEIKGHLVK